MTKEFNLSKEYIKGNTENYYYESSVKEAIKILKEELYIKNFNCFMTNEIIDKIFGDKLTQQKGDENKWKHIK